MSLLIILITGFSMSYGFLLDQKLQHGSAPNVSDTQSAIMGILINKYRELEANSTNLKSLYDDLQRKYLNLEAIINKTMGVNLIHDVNSLRDKINAIGSKTFLIDLNERSRNRDIVALYNKSAEANETISNLKIQTNNRLHQIELDQNVTKQHIQQQFEEVSNRQNGTYYSLMKKIDSIEIGQNVSATLRALNKEIKDYEMRDNKTHEALLQRVSEANEKVGMTACASVDGVTTHDGVIRFDQLRSHVGIADLSTIRSTGKFTCEKAGLYQVSVVINTPTDHARFSTHVNGNLVSTLSVSTDNHVDTGTSVIAVKLQAGDVVWVQADTDIHVYFHWSCMTVVKI